MQKSELNHDYLISRLDYDPETGVFIHKAKPHDSDCRAKQWNARFSGSVAGSFNNKGYINIEIDSKSYKAHRLAWFYVNGQFPDGDIDHINHVKSDNRLSNLRVVTNQQNCMNRSMTDLNTSGAVGVHWCKTNSKWVASIGLNGKRLTLGKFKDKSKAISVRKKAEVEFNFHKNHGVKNG